MRESILVSRSKSWICEGLIESMLKKDYDQITIKEIAANSGVSSRTIYRHFSSKDKILMTHIDYLFADQIIRDIDNDNVNIKDELTALCNFILKHKQFFKLVYEAKKFYLLNDFFNKLSIIGLNTLSPLDKNFAYQNVFYFEYNKKFFESVLTNLMEVWIKNDFKETPDELALVVIQFIESLSRLI